MTETPGRGSAAPYISARTGQFRYFDRQLGRPGWPAKRVLDFGGNVGNLLLDPECTIRHGHYWCLDVIPEAVEEGRRRYPDATFLHYDRYNFEYNPGGTRRLPVPDLGRFDVILAQSVFSHTSKAEMRELVAQLRTFLTDDGVLAFTFIDPYFKPPPGWARAEEWPDLDNLRWRLASARRWQEPGMDVEALEAEATSARITWATLVNNEDFVLDSGGDWCREGEERTHYMVFCTEEHMRSVYPDADVLPPVQPERFSCAVLRRQP
ncbi:class I SAM-dependent methyltransferase [Kitasatospora sp. HPMI-4]|uniref:class I SAM-dependent methyltransferase n=1 Tax=Kitasatospora sp. HPMI-4 TaxID=3448443 RepID=UPI003F1D785E